MVSEPAQKQRDRRAPEVDAGPDRGPAGEHAALPDRYGGGAHHLSRELQSLGHDARLMPAKYVRPYYEESRHQTTAVWIALWRLSCTEGRRHRRWGTRKRVHSAGCPPFEVAATYPFHPFANRTVLVVGVTEHCRCPPPDHSCGRWVGGPSSCVDDGPRRRLGSYRGPAHDDAGNAVGVAHVTKVLMTGGPP